MAAMDAVAVRKAPVSDKQIVIYAGFWFANCPVLAVCSVLTLRLRKRSCGSSFPNSSSPPAEEKDGSIYKVSGNIELLTGDGAMQVVARDGFGRCYTTLESPPTVSC
jgi:hypothetical protein